METIPQVDESGGPLDPLQIVQEQYESSLRALVPTSRNRLAKHLTGCTGMAHKDALDVVDKYCDEKNLPVPAYLSREFTVGWLKVLAIGWVVGAILVLWYGKTLHQQKITPYGLWCIGTLMMGLAVLFWIKSFEVEANNAKADAKGTEGKRLV